jgi:hypothetical protein
LQIPHRQKGWLDTAKAHGSMSCLGVFGRSDT